MTLAPISTPVPRITAIPTDTAAPTKPATPATTPTHTPAPTAKAGNRHTDRGRIGANGDGRCGRRDHPGQDEYQSRYGEYLRFCPARECRAIGGSFTAKSNIPALSVAPAAGTVPASGSVPATIVINRSGLTPGTYSGTVTFMTSSGSFSAVTVTFTV